MRGLSDINPDLFRMIKFCIGKEESMSMAQVDVPVILLWLRFHMYVVKASLSIMVCIVNMDAIGIYLNKPENNLGHPASGTAKKMKQINRHPFLCWSLSFSRFFIMLELKQLHHRFGHPSDNRVTRLLERGNIDDANDETKTGLWKIERECEAC